MQYKIKLIKHSKYKRIIDTKLKVTYDKKITKLLDTERICHII